MAVSLNAVVAEEFGDAFVAAVGYGAARGCPGGQTFFDFDALGFGLIFGGAYPSDFGVGLGDAWDHAGVEGCCGQVLAGMIEKFVA